MADQFNILDQSLAYLQTQALTTGEETVPRHLVGSSTSSLSTQSLRLAFFTARKSETITQVRAVVSGTAAGATPSLVRFGLWIVDSSGNGTLVASTANDTSLFASTNTAYTKALSSSYTKVAGQRYAAGWLCVTATTAPQIFGASPTLGTETAVAPRTSGTWGGQSDLPASFTDANLGTASAQTPYTVLLP